MDASELPAIVAELDAKHKARMAPAWACVVATIWPNRVSIELHGNGKTIYCTGATAREAIAAANIELRRDPHAEAMAAIGCNPDGSIAHWCEDCDERLATETWEPPLSITPTHLVENLTTRLCDECANRRRDRAMERAIEDTL